MTGGTSVTIATQVSASELKAMLSSEFPDIDIRTLSDNSGKQTHLLITVPDEKAKIVSALEKALNLTLTEENSSIEFTSGNLGKDFYSQLLKAMLFAFLLMALVIFITFGESEKIKFFTAMLTLTAAKITFPTVSAIGIFAVLFSLGIFFYGLFKIKEKQGKLILLGILVLSGIIFFFPYYFLIWPITLAVIVLYTYYSAPSIAVITCAFADIVMTVAIVNLLGMSISSGGIVAFLMLIGYSVDTDVLLTTRVLRRKHESINHAAFGAFKTGITMSLTAIAAVLIALFMAYRFETVLNQIFTIIAIGLFFDIFNTWCTNVWIIKWFAETRKAEI